MRAKWLCVAALAVSAVACGGGRAIFNIDVYSFIKGTGKETVPYLVPPGLPPSTASSTPQQISLLGAGSSLVDSVLIFGTADLRNTSGGGTIGFQLFIAVDAGDPTLQTGTYSPSALAFSMTPKAVSGPGTVVPDTISGKLATGANSLFTKSTLWMRVAAQASNANTPPPTAFAGNMVLTSAVLTVVLKPKFF